MRLIFSLSPGFWARGWLRFELALRDRSARAPVLRRQSGQGMVEYALILVLVALVVIVTLTVVGRKVSNVFSNVSNGLNQ